MVASPFDSEHRDGVIRVVPETGEIVALCLEGDFDLTNAPALGDEIDRALERGKGLILDLSEATFIDSSVINVLVRASKAASGREQPWSSNSARPPSSSASSRSRELSNCYPAHTTGRRPCGSFSSKQEPCRRRARQENIPVASWASTQVCSARADCYRKGGDASGCLSGLPAVRISYSGGGSRGPPGSRRVVVRSIRPCYVTFESFDDASRANRLHSRPRLSALWTIRLPCGAQPLSRRSPRERSPGRRPRAVKASHEAVLPQGPRRRRRCPRPFRDAGR
jgi:ABC-type transporter Mla MlaB component